MKKTIGVTICCISSLLLMGASCPSRYSTPPKPVPPSWPPPNVGAKYFFDDADYYGVNLYCQGNVAAHAMPPAFDKMAAAINADGVNFGVLRNSSQMYIPDWLDRDLVPGGEDQRGADSSPLLGFHGHGRVPHSTPGEVLQALSFPVSWTDDQGTEFCGPILAKGHPLSGYQASTSLGRQYSGNQSTNASHGIFFSSCVLQPGLLDGLTQKNNLSQAFGFSYSPNYLAMYKVSEKLAAFYMNSGVVGNARAWVDMFDRHPNQTAQLGAGATAATLSIKNDPNVDEWHLASQAPPWGTHMLRLGRFATRRLPAQTPSNGYSARVLVSSDGCRVDQVCGSPDPELTGSCPLDGTSEMPLEGAPTRTLTSELDAAPVGTQAIQFAVQRSVRTDLELADATAWIASRMTKVRFERAETIYAAQQALLKPRYQYTEANTGEGIAFWYDSAKDRLRVIDFIVEDTFDSSGAPVVVSPEQAANVVKEWVEHLDDSGMVNSRFWNLRSPVGGQITAIDAEFGPLSSPIARNSLWAYTFTIMRSVNGIPFADEAAQIWIHRSGQVILVDVSGHAPRVSGNPGFEFSEPKFPLVTIRLPRDQSLSRAKDFVQNTFGFDAYLQGDVVVYRTKRDAEKPELVRLVSFTLSKHTGSGEVLTGGSVTVAVPVTSESGQVTVEDDD